MIKNIKIWDKLWCNYITDIEKKIKNTKKYIGFNVAEDTKLTWQNFAESHDFSTISKLIRKAVNFYVDGYSKISYLENISKTYHGLKEPLTSIKGFSQLIIERYSNQLEAEILLRIKEIFNQSIFLEKKINEILSDIEPEKETYDILIVEDDSATIMVLTDFFELRGYYCKGVTTGTKGLEELTRYSPKLILLDIVLPDIDGYEICKKIKFDEKYKRFRDIPIYFITAVPESEVSKKINGSGAEGFLSKPFEFPSFEILFSYL